MVISKKAVSIRVRVLWIAVVCFALSGTVVRAQFDSATLTGVVTDPSSAVVSGAEIKAINEATNIETSTSANAAGRYQFSNLRPGSYRIEATADGFKQFVSTGL